MGLIFLPEKVKQYMKDKVFLDCGAFIGDSALAMLEFEPSKVLAFDMSPKNAREFMKTMERNQIPKSKAELIQCGVGDAETDISFEDGYDISTSLYRSGNTKAHINTLDNLCENSGGIGFIKADLEGNGFRMVKGMTKILKRDRPVLSLAIYHN